MVQKYQDYEIVKVIGGEDKNQSHRKNKALPTGMMCDVQEKERLMVNGLEKGRRRDNKELA